jgi:hypothetical protein
MAAGVDKIPLRIPREWDPKWFADFIRDVLALADIRNAQGDGVEISGQSSDVATLTVSQDIQDLLQQTYVLAAPSGFLQFERTLAGETGVVTITDGGANGNITVSITANGINLGKLQQLSNQGILGNPETTPGNVVNISPDEDGDALQVLSGVIGWTLTPTWGGFHTWLDGAGVKIGTGGDLSISHNGTNSIVNNITGELRLQASGVDALAIEAANAVDMRAQFQRSAVISPSQLVANTDNWGPTGLATASVIRFSTDASRNLTGITAQPGGTELLLVNVGSFNCVLSHDATSTAANRFLCPGSASFTLAAGEAVWIWYDSTSSRWRIGAPAKSAGGSGSTYAVYANSDQSKTSDTTLADDAVLVATLSANKKYRLEFDVYWDSSATPDLKFDLNFTGTTTSIFYVVDNRSGPTANLATISTSAAPQSFACTALNAVFTFNLSATSTVWERIVVGIEVGASGGTFSLRWAQNTSNASATVRRRNSCLLVTEVS